MQNQMKSQPPLFALVPVPYEALVDAGIEIGDPLQFTVEKGKVTMEKISSEDMDFVCDGNCEGCPIRQKPSSIPTRSAAMQTSSKNTGSAAAQQTASD